MKSPERAFKEIDEQIEEHQIQIETIEQKIKPNEQSPKTPREYMDKVDKFLKDTMLNKSWKSMKIFTLQSQIDKYYTYKIQQKKLQNYFVLWIDYYQETLQTNKL